MKILLLLLSLIPFLTNLYVTKYLHDIKENKHCRQIDSNVLSFYYDYYIISSVILLVSIIGLIFVLNKYTDIFKIKSIQKLINILEKNKRLVEILSISFSFGLVKLIYDLKKEPECDKIDHDMATNIYYYSIIGIFLGILNLLGIKLY